MKSLEMLNRVYLRGIVGSVNTQGLLDENKRTSVKFSVATNYAYRDRNGQDVIETNWVSATAITGGRITDATITQLHKGCGVQIQGRLRVERFTSEDGQQKNVPVVVCQTLEVLAQAPFGTVADRWENE